MDTALDVHREEEVAVAMAMGLEGCACGDVDAVRAEVDDCGRWDDSGAISCLLLLDPGDDNPPSKNKNNMALILIYSE